MSKVLVVWWNMNQFLAKIQNKQHIAQIAHNLIRVYPSMHRVLKSAPTLSTHPGAITTADLKSSTGKLPQQPSLLATGSIARANIEGSLISEMGESQTATAASGSSSARYLTGKAIRRYFEFKFSKLDHSIAVSESTSLFTDEAGAQQCIDMVLNALQARFLVHTLELANLA
ncbi:hypothetical protein BC828DRAFT_373640 [Blastocladiella britannica]|nr:hypothetical protein BC828DRAFT_373640 [Blastocladiella britannica]